MMGTRTTRITTLTAWISPRYSYRISPDLVIKIVNIRWHRVRHDDEWLFAVFHGLFCFVFYLQLANTQNTNYVLDYTRSCKVRQSERTKKKKLHGGSPLIKRNDERIEYGTNAHAYCRMIAFTRLVHRTEREWELPCEWYSYFANWKMSEFVYTREIRIDRNGFRRNADRTTRRYEIVRQQAFFDRH